MPLTQGLKQTAPGKRAEEKSLWLIGWTCATAYGVLLLTSTVIWS